MKFLAAAAGLVAAVSAYSYPTPFNPTAGGAAPSGNAVLTPDTTSPVTLGSPYQITWEPTTPGPIALVLCQGPSTNCEPILTIADKVANNGEFTWTPSDLPPSASSSGGYGIMLIDYATKAYQYSTQFGLLAGASSAPAPAAPKTISTSTVNIIPSSSAAASTPVTVVVQSTSTYCPVEQATSPSVPYPSAPAPYSTGVPVPLSTGVPVPLATGTVSVPWTTSPAGSSVPTTLPSNAPTPPAYTGAASSNMVNYGVMGAAAGFAALLAF